MNVCSLSDIEQFCPLNSERQRGDRSTTIGKWQLKHRLTISDRPSSAPTVRRVHGPTAVARNVTRCRHNATQCNATQRNATQRNATQRNATQRNATQRNATQRNATQRNATQRNATQRNATQRNATQRNATQRNATQRNATQRNATQRNATQRNATQRNATQRNATSHSTRGPVNASGDHEVFASTGLHKTNIQSNTREVPTSQRHARSPLLVA